VYNENLKVKSLKKEGKAMASRFSIKSIFTDIYLQFFVDICNSIRDICI